MFDNLKPAVAQTARQAPLPFLDEHLLIRPLDDDAAIVKPEPAAGPLGKGGS